VLGSILAGYQYSWIKSFIGQRVNRFSVSKTELILDRFSVYTKSQDLRKITNK
jgi:hypothetical protein